MRQYEAIYILDPELEADQQTALVERFQTLVRDQGGEIQHVDLLIQPEYFEGDLTTTTGMWAADQIKAAGYDDVLRHPGFDAMAMPSLVGNVFDFSADQQAHIAVRPRRPGGGSWLIGQPPAPGLAAVTPWVVPDPVRAGEPFPERRTRLGEAGKKLAPGSGVACPDPAKPGPCENGHVEGLAGHGDVCSKPRTGPKGGDSHALLVAALRESAATPDGGDPSRQSAPRTRGWLSRTSSAGTPAV